MRTLALSVHRHLAKTYQYATTWQRRVSTPPPGKDSSMPKYKVTQRFLGLVGIDKTRDHPPTGLWRFCDRFEIRAYNAVPSWTMFLREIILSPPKRLPDHAQSNSYSQPPDVQYETTRLERVVERQERLCALAHVLGSHHYWRCWDSIGSHTDFVTCCSACTSMMGERYQQYVTVRGRLFKRWFSSDIRAVCNS